MNKMKTDKNVNIEVTVKVTQSSMYDTPNLYSETQSTTAAPNLEEIRAEVYRRCNAVRGALVSKIDREIEAKAEAEEATQEL